MTSLAAETAPGVLNEPHFVDHVHDLLARLPGPAPGLGLLVATRDANIVAVYPRAGRNPSTLEDLLALSWFRVNATELGPHMPVERADAAEVRKLLEALQATR